jgi:hypothetical protein
MPRVPAVTGPSAELAPLPNVRQSIDAPVGAFAGSAQQAQQLGHALKSVEGAAATFFRERQEREDADMLLRAGTALTNEWVDQERQLRNRNGQDAWGATEDTKKWFDDAVKRNSEGLTNERQRLLFRRQAEALRARGVEYAGRHEDEQRKKSLVESGQASIVADINLAAADPSPDSIGKARTTIGNKVEAVGRLSGWTPEKIALEKQNQTGTLHTQVLQAMVENDPMKAEAYFAANKAEIPGVKHAEIEKTVRLGTTKVKAQAFADEAVKRGVPEADAIKLIREKYTGDEEDTFVTTLKGRIAEQHAARERLQGDAAEAAWGVIEQGGGWSAIPTKVQADMDPRTRIAIKNHLKEKANSAAVDRTRTDWALYAQLREEAAADPAAFAKKSLVQHFDKLAPAQRESLLDLKAAAGKPDKTQDVVTLQQQLGIAHNLLKLGNGDQEKKGRFDAVTVQALNDARKVKGSDLTQDERQKVIDKMMIENDSWFFGGKRFYEVAGTPDAAKFTPTISDADRAGIVTAFKKRGVAAPTDAQILQAFKAAKGL